MQGGFTSTAPLIRVETWRTRCHTLLHRPSDTPGGRRLRIATFALILLSTACFILQSIPELHGFSTGWVIIDGIVAVLFTVEYVIRIIVAPDGRGDEENDELQRPPPASRCQARALSTFKPQSPLARKAYA